MVDQEPARGGNFELNNPTIVALLHLVGIVTGGIVNLVAVVLAYNWKDDRGQPAWAQSHHRFHIRTFWYSLVLTLLGIVLAIVLIGFVILALVAVYVAVRSFLALQKAQRREPVPDPEALFW